jgi:outer membrane lipoprotein-sorting protein
MKKSLLLLVLALGLLTSSFAQDVGEESAKMTADQIINEYIKAIGGAEAWQSLEGMKVVGKISMMGVDYAFVTTMGAPNLMRLDVDIMGQKMVQSFDGETSWHIMPMMGINKPTEMSEAEARQINRNQLLPEFIDYANRGYTVELVDSREIEGVFTQGIRLTDGKDKDQTYYFDLENYVPIMTEVIITEGPMKGSIIETYLSDYTEIGNGMIIPFFNEVRMPQGSQKMTYTKVELNPELEEGFFSMPTNE